MQIHLRKTLAEAIGVSKFTQFGINKDSWGWKDDTYLDLPAMTRYKVDDLRALLSEHEELRGVATLIRDIDTWLLALHDPESINSVKPRSPRQFEALVIRLLGLTPGHRVYKRYESMDDVFLAYYVEKVEYHARYESNGHVIPEHVTIDYHFEDFRGKQEEREQFRRADCVGMSVIEALARKNFYPETKSLRKQYLSDVKRWGDLVKQIGKQMLAYGMADDNGVDGNPQDSNHWYYSRVHTYKMAAKDGPAKVLVDIFREDIQDKERQDRYHCDTWFWTIGEHKKLIEAETTEVRKKGHSFDTEDEENLLESLDVSTPEIEVPIHPFVIVFDLKKHLRLRIHIHYLAEYCYDKSMIDKLILPSELKSLVAMLIEHEGAEFKDIVEGKSGGAVVLLCGPPGVGKTLTAEVYAEAEERGLYSVQCSQLGVKPAELEEELLKCFTRAQRWGAVMLLDEADVYVKERGGDLNQNAIVGVFLRVLEYQSNVLFLTTNRPDDVDDAIASRCIARLNYQPPKAEQQAAIWRVLSQASSITIEDETILEIVEANPNITGRDVKNLLKLAYLISISKGGPIDLKAIEFAKQFKPTQKER